MLTSGGGGGVGGGSCGSNNTGNSSNCLEFLHCNKCFYPLSVIPNDSPHRPFSLTNCWHIFCGVCFKKHGAKSNFCCVCTRTPVRTMRLESPMPDSIKRLFYNHVAEWEANQVWAEERRRVHASALRQVAKALEDIAVELSSSKSDDGASMKKMAQTANFQLDQWRSLARGYSGMWTEFRKAKEELKKYQSELHNVQKALKDAEEEKRKMKEKLRELYQMQQQQQQQQQQRRNDSLQQQHQPGSTRPTTSTPAFFDQSNSNVRSPFFRKNPVPPQKAAYSSSGGSGRENRDPAASGGQRRSTSPFCHAQSKSRQGAASVDARDKMRLQTPKIFADADLGMVSPYFGPGTVDIMAHWFHRNPLKATGMVTFDLRAVATTPAAAKITSELRMTRNKLIDIVKDPNLEVETLDTAMQQYFSLLLGLIYPPKGVHDSGGDSKLRYAFTFRWNDSLQSYDQEPTKCDDALFEALNMLINVALWFTKHAAKIAGAKDEPSMDEAKEVHKCLRRAAGIFKFIKENVGRLLQVGEKNSDLDTRVMTAYLHMCTAEAQEVTIARAVSQKHAPSLISAIANETSNMFAQADKSLESLDQELVAKWRHYLALKAKFYNSYAYCYQGDALLAEDKGGEAIASLKTCKSLYEETQAICKEYHATKGQGTTAKPQEHQFYVRFGPVVARTLEKTERENGFIYHQMVPDKPNELELKATYGLASPEELVLPEMNEQWSEETYKSFDLTLNKIDPKEKKKKEKEESGPLPPVKEAEIPQSMKQSVCSVM